MPVPPHSFCALTECARLLVLACEIQLTQLAKGYVEPVREITVLFQLQEYIRVGICPRTRVLDATKMPGLNSLLDQLPPAWSRRLVDAITAEATGHAFHGRVSMPPAFRVIPGPLEADYGPQTQPMR